MAEVSRSIPQSINYQDVLPVAVPAIARRRRFYPQNGTVFNALGTQEIRIQLESVNSLLDPRASYLEMFLFNNDAAQTFGMDLGGAHALFDEVWVEQGGRVLAREQAHNRLHAGVLSVAQVNDDGGFAESVTALQRGCNAAGGGAVAQVSPFAVGGNGDAYVNRNHNDVAQVPANTGVRLTMAMPTGLFTQNKLIPLPLVDQSSPITLCFRMAQADVPGVWSAAIAANALEIRRINYVAQLIEVGGDVLNQFRQMQGMGGGQLTISSTDWEHSQGTLPTQLGGGEVIIRVPIRKRSVKSLFWQANSQDLTNGAGGLLLSDLYNLSFGGNCNTVEWQLKVGSVVYPPTPVQGWGATTLAGAEALNPGRGECAMELAKALGTLGFTNPTGRLSGITYGLNNQLAPGLGQPALADGDNGDGAGANIATQSQQIASVCPFGLDLDAFQQTAIEAGLDSETLAQETNLVLTVDNGGSGAEDKNIHTWILFDQHYYFNADGNITISN